MKNYIIGTLLVVILVLSSIIFKNSQEPFGATFPIDTNTLDRAKDIEIPLYLYVFFSKRNCRDCLQVIDVLNNLPPQFIVTGVVKANELENEVELRGISEAKFPLVAASNYKKYIPRYSPTIIGISHIGTVLFTLPGVPGGEEYLLKFLESLYGKSYSLFLNEKQNNH